MTAESETWMGGPQREFATTLWTVVVNAKNPASPERREALQKLIETYWKPLYHYVRRKGHDSDAAKDTVQSFFTALLEKDLLQYVQPGRARFRTFLLLALKHDMNDDRDRAAALKRGGGKPLFSLDISSAEREVADSPASEASPDQTFRRQWGLRVLEQALEALQAEFHADGKSREFQEIRLHLGSGFGLKRSYSDIGAALGLTEDDVRRLIHRARGLYREQVLRVIRSYTETPEEVQRELNDLFTAFS